MKRYPLAQLIRGVPTSCVRKYLKRTGKSVLDINWYALKPGVLGKLIREEVRKLK